MPLGVMSMEVAALTPIETSGTRRRMASASGGRFLPAGTSFCFCFRAEGVVVLRMPRAVAVHKTQRSAGGEEVQPVQEHPFRQSGQKLLLKLLPTAARHHGDGHFFKQFTQEPAHVGRHGLFALRERAVEVKRYNFWVRGGGHVRLSGKRIFKSFLSDTLATASTVSAPP